MQDVSVLSMLLRLVVSMGVVVSLMLLAARLLRRSAAGLSGRGGKRVRRTAIDVAALQPVTKAAHIAVVRAAGRELVVGVTDHQVTLLHSSIEPRGDLDDLDVLVTPTGTDGDAAPARDMTTTPSDLPTARTRTVLAAATDTDPSGTATGGASAWTDALEMLREKTVRR